MGILLSVGLRSLSHRWLSSQRPSHLSLLLEKDNVQPIICDRKYLCPEIASKAKSNITYSFLEHRVLIHKIM